MLTTELKGQAGSVRLVGYITAPRLTVDLYEVGEDFAVHLLDVDQINTVIGLLQEMVKEAERLGKEPR